MKSYINLQLEGDPGTVGDADLMEDNNEIAGSAIDGIYQRQNLATDLLEEMNSLGETTGSFKCRVCGQEAHISKNCQTLEKKLPFQKENH